MAEVWSKDEPIIGPQMYAFELQICCQILMIILLASPVDQFHVHHLNAQNMLATRVTALQTHYFPCMILQMHPKKTALSKVPPLC